MSIQLKKQLALALFTGIAGSGAAAQNYLMWQMPNSEISFPVYVYSKVNGKQVQTNFLYGTTQQAFVGPYSVGSTSGSYMLYYATTSGGATNWYGCSLVLKQGSVDSSSTCPGAVINAPVANSNVYTLAIGATTWPSANQPPSPVNPNYGNRSITFINNTGNYLIQIGEVCTVSKNPNNPNCVNNANLFQIRNGQSKVLTVDNQAAEGSNFPAGLISYGFTMTGYQKTASSKMIATGGYGSGTTYATKIEGTTLPVSTVNGVQIPQGASNFDVSAVDGYNVSVIAYPDKPTYCTYTVPPENSNVLGAGLYGPGRPLAKLTIARPAQLCKASSQLPPGQNSGAWNLWVSDGQGNFQGCMSPCSYATQTYGSGSQQANQYCCTGSYNTPASCDMPAGQAGANNSTYVQNLKPPTSQNVYRFAYDDAIGDFACPAETNFVVRFVAQQAG